MFRLDCVSKGLFRSFPRIRGDVPRSAWRRTTCDLFSPHTRGCSLGFVIYAVFEIVFPAYAGMFLMAGNGHGGNARFPRIRGDVPSVSSGQKPRKTFSPHTRGCSCKPECTCSVSHVFPAYAGMFLLPRHCITDIKSFPRIRGDVPLSQKLPKPILTFSPHTRGCSSQADWTGLSVRVFPAYAGMFLSLTGEKFVEMGFPRIRGDVPTSSTTPGPGLRFSPHTRGCSF